jgi:MFS transporter, DHA1 family, inner membrane transport protein
MNFFGYFAPVAERVAGFSASDLTWVLAVVGLGVLVGNWQNRLVPELAA